MPKTPESQIRRSTTDVNTFNIVPIQKNKSSQRTLTQMDLIDLSKERKSSDARDNMSSPSVEKVPFEVDISLNGDSVTNGVERGIRQAILENPSFANHSMNTRNAFIREDQKRKNCEHDDGEYDPTRKVFKPRYTLPPANTQSDNLSASDSEKDLFVALELGRPISKIPETMKSSEDLFSWSKKTSDGKYLDNSDLIKKYNNLKANFQLLKKEKKTLTNSYNAVVCEKKKLLKENKYLRNQIKIIHTASKNVSFHEIQKEQASDDSN